ncbi:methyl-accepting chemotaxis protein [Geomonas silvestris]|uniref:Methyl-accepting chemotaxis protein n=1 Tax=Geomonas silvestris TaxID=2740184 RepID=A0A6V8MEB7_9BACT|nr:HAMP domain-containing methyl-accepting chemotaxis protein [Geomonas silvestris]GFO58338.1 methyl-accepting chemotaxis protein [Geomonas silvestris]
MAKNNLRFGYHFIRYSLAAGCAVGLAGSYCAYQVVHAVPEGPVPAGYALGTLWALGLEAALFIAVFAVFAARNLAKRVKVLADALNHGADGDLTCRLDTGSDDEFGKLHRNFNVMMEQLAGVVSRVAQSISELQKIASDIDQVSKKGLTSAELQSEGVAEASQAVGEINQSVQQIAKWVDDLSGSATDNASAILEMSASIEQVNQHVDTLSLAAEEVSSSIIEMTAAEKQIGASAQSLLGEATTASALVAELDVSIKQVGENALHAAKISDVVRQDAQNGAQAVEATISGIGEIRSSSRSTVKAMQNLSLRAADIGKILLVIDEVAEQTNLLALNASIIAAQAGEQGKGFAVVAHEIKELARRTSSSTREISEIIEGVKEETTSVVQAIKASEERIAEGELLSQRSGEALRKIVDGVQDSAPRVNEIAQTTEEQAKLSENMRQAMDRVAEMVGQIVRATREQGRGSEQIVSAVERMKDFTAQVRSTTRSQTATSSHIVHATEDITQMIRNVRRACEEEAESTKQIVRAMESIRESSLTTVEVNRIMDGAVTGLSEQVKLLQQKMAGLAV